MPRSRIAIASADICSSATAPRVYASITQSICASLSVPPSRLVAMTSTAANGSLMRSAPCTRPADLGWRGPPSPAQDSSPSASTTTTRGVRARPQATAVRRVRPGRALLEDAALGSPGRRRSRPTAPSRRSTPAARRRCPGGRRRCPRPCHSRSRAGSACGPGARSRSSRAERVRQQLRHRQRAVGVVDQALRAAVLPQQLAAPPARHQRLARTVHTGHRDQPATAGGVQRRRPRRTRRTAPRRRRRSPRCSRRRPGRRRPVRPRRPGSCEYGAYACPITSVAAARSAAQSTRRSTRGSAHPFTYGLPSAAGARTRPTRPATATIVARYGSMFRNWLGIGLAIAPR